ASPRTRRPARAICALLASGAIRGGSMHDPTESDLALADRVNEIARDTFPISTNGPLPEHARRALAAAAARAQRLAFEQARLCVAAIPATALRTRFYQPFEG